MRTSPILFLMLLVFRISGETIWIADQTSGSDTGADAANAHSISWFNTSGNWDTDVSDDGKIGPGDTVMFTGTITNQATIQGSGSSGNPITFTFASGAKFSAPTWTSTGAITATDKNYFIIDGGNSGTMGALGATDAATWNTNVEATDNGTALTYQTTGIRLVCLLGGSTGCGNVTVRNMKVIGSYVRTAGSADSNDGGTCIMLESSGDSIIWNNYVRDSESAIYLKGVGTNISGLHLKSNTVYRVSNGMHFANKSGYHTTTNGSVYRNRINLTDAWEGGPHHNDGFQTISAQTSNRIWRLQVSHNWIGPDFGSGGDANAPIYMEHGVVDCAVFNNLIEVASGDVLSNPSITAGPAEFSWFAGYSEGLIAHNTIMNNGGNGGIAGPHMRIYGNVVSGASTLMNVNSTRSDQNVDYQVFYYTAGNVDGEFYDPAVGIYSTLASWKSAGWDANSIAQDPLINSDGTLQAGSPAIEFVPWSVAQNYTNWISDDFYGNARPTGAAWDAGAFQYDVTPYVPTIVTNNASGARVSGFRNLAMAVLPAPAGTSYVWKQDFEGTGYGNGQTWTESGSGILNEDYTSTVLVGSQSMNIDLTSNIGAAYGPLHTLVESPTIHYAYFQLRVISFPSSSFRIFSISNVLDVSISATSNLTVRPAVGTAVATVGMLEAGVAYHVWTSGSGQNVETASAATARVAFSTDGIRPTSGDNYAIDTDAGGSSGQNPAQVSLGSLQVGANYNIILDKIRVNDVVIGDNPE